MAARAVQLRARMPILEALSRWYGFLERFTPRTQEHYRMCLERFALWAPVRIRDLTLEHFESYIYYMLHSEGLSPRAVNAHLTAIKSFAKYLHDHYGIECPVRKLKMLREDPPKVRIVTPDEFNKILSVCDQEERDVILFVANTGLRLAEIKNLTWKQITHDLKGMRIPSTKSHRERFVPLNQTCQEILKRAGGDPNSTTMNFLLKSKRFKGHLYWVCQCLARRAAIPRFGPHALRHYFATELYRKGIPLHLLSKILGHADTRTTEKIYIHILPERDLLGITDCLD